MGDGQYILDKDPVVIELKYKGIYVLHAVSENKPTIKDPLEFYGGDIIYFIEF